MQSAGTSSFSGKCKPCLAAVVPSMGARRQEKKRDVAYLNFPQLKADSLRNGERSLSQSSRRVLFFMTMLLVSSENWEGLATGKHLAVMPNLSAQWSAG